MKLVLVFLLSVTTVFAGSESFLDKLSDIGATVKQVEEQLADYLNAENLNTSVLRDAYSGQSPLCPKFQENLVFYNLYTIESNDPYKIRVGDNSALYNSGYDPKRNTTIYIHGWLQNSETQGPRIAQAYFDDGKINNNVLVADWSKYSLCLYQTVRKSIVPSMGELTARLIQQLVDYGTNPKDIHIVGFSFGGEIAGYAAKSLRFKIGRITGLDPAGPLFNFVSSDYRLDKSDADFVDVIHSNMNFWGISKQIGHVDFYPNGGYSQNGCFISNVCSHNRVVTYFLESMTTDVGFYGVKCNNYMDHVLGMCKNNHKAVMGVHVDNSVRGKYYLYTNSYPPYAQGNSQNRRLIHTLETSENA